MDSKKLIKLLDKASKEIVFKKDIQPWMLGTFWEISERSLNYKVSKDTEKELMEFIEKQDELKEFNGKTLNRGDMSYNVMTYKTLIRELLCETSFIGAKKTVENLEKYSSLDHTPGYEVLAISGIEVDKKYEIIDGIEIVPFSEMPSSFPKDHIDHPLLKLKYLRSKGYMPSDDLSRAKTALVKKIKISPKTYEQGDSPKIHKTDQTLFDLCECLTLIGPCTPMPIAHWFMPEDWVPCRHIGGSFGSPSKDVPGNKIHKFENQSINEFKKIFKKFSSLKKLNRDKLRIPILRLNQALRRIYTVDKAIDLGIAFESLLLNDRQHFEQISLLFRLRGAWLLAKNIKERKKLIKEFQRIYNLRSMAVHGGNLGSKDEKKLKPPTEQFLKESMDLCAKSIIKVFDDGGFPIWNELILGK